MEFKDYISMKYHFLRSLGFSSTSAYVWKSKSIKSIDDRLRLLGFDERFPSMK